MVLDYPGVYIAFEGLNGSGKDSQIERLVDHLRGEMFGRDILVVREPGYEKSPVCLKFRELTHAKEIGGEVINPRTKVYSFVADRVQLVEKHVRPALETDRSVISNRVWWSSASFQGEGQRLGLEYVTGVNLNALGEMVPDLYVLLDTSVETSMKRMNDVKGDCFEREKFEFHSRVLEGYRKLAESFRDRTIVIDANHDKDVVFQDIVERVIPRLKKL